jgi:tetratricopeptide (TPR) repeat protein/predicted Ser/Thr protein kinase
LEPENKTAVAVVKQLEKEQQASGVVERFKKFSDGLLHGPQDDAALKATQTGMGNAAGGSAGAAKTAAAEPTAGLTAGAPGVAASGNGTTVAMIGGPAPTVRGLSESHYQFAPLVLKALSKQGMGDFTGALLDLSQELDQNPKDLPAWIVRAEVDNSLKNFPAGIHDAGKALELAPENARALRARAYAELESGDAAAAYADASKAASLEPENGLAYLYMAMAEEKSGRAADAIRDLRKAVALDPALEPLARPLAKTLGITDAPATSAKRPLLRGGLIALSMALVLFGLLGTQRGRAITRSITSRPSAAPAFDGDAPAELTPGTVLGGTYTIVRELGRGGMGVVYEGRDQTLDRRVAIKRLIQDASTTPDDVARFLREARLVAALKHPNLAQIFNVLPGREPFLVFEFVDGKPLDQVLRDERVLPLPAARRIVREVAGALGAAHAAAIIHRDLKPGNVMIGPDGAAKVMDFGIAHQSHAAATRMTQTIASGTPPYMPPEQVMGSVSKASDLYALGVMAYELVTGARPFEGPDFLEQKIQRRYQPATARNASLPRSLDAFFAQALDPDPTKRHEGAAAFADAFERACDATPRASAARA